MKFAEVHERLDKSSKWWLLNRGGILKIITLVLSGLLALKGKDPDQALQLIAQVLEQIGTVLVALAALGATLTGLEDAARKLFVTTPLPGEAQTPEVPK